MKTFLKLGSKNYSLQIGGVDISNFAIVMHSDGGLKGAPVLLAQIAKAGGIIKKYVYLITGVELPVYYDIFPLRREYEIRIGDTDRDKEKRSFAPDEYLFYTEEKALVFHGGIRGILYGVYTFLEKYCGVRFFTDIEEKILDCERIAIENIYENYAPIFEYRELCDWNAWDADFSVKMKLNGTFIRKLRKEDGYGVGFAGGAGGLVHTFGRLLPVGKYYKEHPEYFALEGNGVRNPGGLCFASEEGFEELYANACGWLKKEKSPTLISISINDGEMTYCQCEKCREIYEKGGNKTDAVLAYVNKFARRVKKDYPSILVDTISYAATSAPPQIVKPEDNVAVRICTWCYGNVPILDSEELYVQTANKKYEIGHNVVKRIKAFSEITNKIYVWDYPYTYFLINDHYPVLSVLRKNYRFYAEHNVKGGYINGETDTADFCDLKIYMISKLLFNPLMSEEEWKGHYEDFLYGFYGKGGKYIQEFLDYTDRLSLQAAPYASNEPMCNVYPFEKNADGTFDRSFVDTCRELFEKAYAAAETVVEKQRIEKASLVVDSYELNYMMPSAMETGSEEEKAYFEALNKAYYGKIVKFAIPRVTENTFFPVVKNFKQSPREWDYWDNQCIAGDRNNERYDRELYLLIPFSEEKGSSVSKEFLIKTNNENANGFLSVYTKEGFVSTDCNPTWEGTKGYPSFRIENGLVTDVYEFSEASGIPLTDLRINLLPKHLKGVIVKVNTMDAGGYIFFRKKEVKL